MIYSTQIIKDQRERRNKQKSVASFNQDKRLKQELADIDAKDIENWRKREGVKLSTAVQPFWGSE